MLGLSIVITRPDATPGLSIVINRPDATKPTYATVASNSLRSNLSQGSRQKCAILDTPVIPS
jgi:hypothetical protein